METLAALTKKIAKLQQQADAIRAKERKSVIDSVRADIIKYDLTPAELFSTKNLPKSAKKGGAQSAKSTPAKTVPIRYKDQDGNTWTGRGKRPKWLEAHLENGLAIEDFMIEPAPEPKAKKGGARQPVPIRYQDGLGNKWTGRGKQPKWLRSYLDNGHDLGEFRIGGSDDLEEAEESETPESESH